MSPKGGKEMAFLPGTASLACRSSSTWPGWLRRRNTRRSGNTWRPGRRNTLKPGTQQSTQLTPHYAKRIDLKPIITQEVVEKVRSHSQNTQLKLIITFNNDDVDIQAIAYQWRR
jgi:hypothetical protein